MHTSLSRFGHVQGGAQTIIEALIEAVGPSGTVMMPALSAGRFDPSEWPNPSVPEDRWDRIRYESRLYHPLKTPTVDVGIVSELFRTWPGPAECTPIAGEFKVPQILRLSLPATSEARERTFSDADSGHQMTAVDREPRASFRNCLTV